MLVKSRDWLSLPLLLAALACGVVGLFPHHGWQIDPQTNDRVSTWTIGLPFSPLWIYVHRMSLDGTFNWKATIQFVCWSWASIIIGVTLFGIRKRRRTKHQYFSDTDVITALQNKDA